MSDCRFGVSPVNYPDPDPQMSQLLLYFIARVWPSLSCAEFAMCRVVPKSKIRGALWKTNDGGKWSFRPIMDYSFVLPDYPYSANVSAH